MGALELTGNTLRQVFLDIDCLQDGQSWLAGFVQGVVASMVFVPVWTSKPKPRNPKTLTLNPRL